MSTFNADLYLLTMYPALLNSLSDAQLVACMDKYDLAKRFSSGIICVNLLHQVNGQSSNCRLCFSARVLKVSYCLLASMTAFSSCCSSSASLCIDAYSDPSLDLFALVVGEVSGMAESRRP